MLFYLFIFSSVFIRFKHHSLQTRTESKPPRGCLAVERLKRAQPDLQQVTSQVTQLAGASGCHCRQMDLVGFSIQHICNPDASW